MSRFLLTDPVLEPIAEKVEAGDRLSKEDGMALYGSADLLGIGQLADFARRRLNGDRVYFMVNRHINPTNLCVNRCKFCAFSRDRGQEGAYELTVEEMVEASVAAVPDGIHEIHLVGGLHPEWSLAFYEDLLRRLKRALPSHVLLQGFTAVEIEHFGKMAALPTLDVLKRLRDAGLDSMPGGGAEIFSERTRQAAWDKKTSGDDWLRIHGEAHSLGMKTNCTMLYGHIETREERVEHLVRLRAQQDASGGFLAFIPLAFHPQNTELSSLPGTTGWDDLKTLAVSRLLLDNIAHVKSFWIMVGLKVAQLATSFGADDIDGTVVEERITHMAGATTPQSLTKDDLVALIAETGHTPVERDTLYRVVREYPSASSGACGR